MSCLNEKESRFSHGIPVEEKLEVEAPSVVVAARPPEALHVPGEGGLHEMRRRKGSGGGRVAEAG